MTWEKFRTECAKLIGVHFSLLEVPPNEVDADLAFPCFSLAKEQRKNPFEIAKELEAVAGKKKMTLVKGVKAVGPYVNFYIDYAKFSPALINEIISEKEKYGPGSKKKEKIVIESPGPNTNKPLHLGHVRNIVLGSSLANIYDFLGYDVKRVDIINDRGVHICKSMLAYEKLGNGKEPDKKTDHFVGDYYVLFAKKLEGQPGTEEELRKMLIDWESGDKKIMELWKKMNDWAISGFKQTYKRLGMHIDKEYYESEHYKDGKDIVMKGLNAKIFKKDNEGNIIIDLEDLGKRTLLRADGTSVYITQDMALVVKRYNEFHMDKMIYVVAEEQTDHFNALFKILEILGYPFAKNCYHLSYGMVNLPEGKMKSREGTVVDADDLMDEMHNMAENKIRERNPNEKEIKERAEKIGMAALKYFIVKFDPNKPITYDPSASIEFEGDTGPYLQYTYARANSIKKKSKKNIAKSPVFSQKIEFDMIRKMSQFHEIVDKSAKDYKPNILANYLFELASMFNEFYHSAKVVGEKEEPDRLALVTAVMQVIKNGTKLLGIDTINEM